MPKTPNGLETLPKISIAWVGCTNVTDDRQTDRRIYDDIIANVNAKKLSNNIRVRVRSKVCSNASQGVSVMGEHV